VSHRREEKENGPSAAALLVTKAKGVVADAQTRVPPLT
jgi:hypothetical protein